VKPVKPKGSPSTPHKADLCEPVLFDAVTGKPEPSPVGRAVLKVWAEATDEERSAYHRFCCLRSRAEEDTKTTEALCWRFMVEGAKQTEDIKVRVDGVMSNEEARRRMRRPR